MAERIEPQVHARAGDAPGLRFRVWTEQPFFEVRVATSPQLFLEGWEARRVPAQNYWTTARGGEPTPAAPEQTVAVPDDLVRAARARGEDLYYLLVGYPSLSREEARFSMRPEDALAGVGPKIELGNGASALPAVAAGLSRSLMFDDGSGNGHGGVAPGNGGSLYAASSVDPAGSPDAAAFDYGPNDKKNPAELTWPDLQLVRGGDGKDHLYYLTTGGPLGKAKLTLRVRNKNDHLNFQDQRLSVSLRAVGKAGSKYAEEIIPFDGQKPGEKYKTYKRSGEIVDESHADIPIEIDRDTLEKAYNADFPLTVLDVEYRWRQGPNVPWVRTYGRQKSRLSFLLVEPVNLMHGKMKRGDLVKMDDPVKHFNTFWIGLVERRFGKNEKAPIDVTGTLKYAISRSRSSTVSAVRRVSATQTDSETKGREISVGVGAERAGKGSFGFKLEKVFDVGIESSSKLTASAGYKSLRSVTRTTATTEELIDTVSRTDAFTNSFEKAQTISQKLEPGKAGELRVLYAYPVFRLYHAPLVLFEANDRGQASSRREIADFPILQLEYFGYTSLPEDEIVELKK